MPGRIKELARKYMGDYELLAAKKKQLTSNLTEQIYFEVKGSDKFEALCRIIDIEDDFYSIVFCRTKIDVDEVATHLIDRGYDAAAIHGDIVQAQRERTLSSFRSRKIDILIATDVAARGIDVNDLTHVINYSLPGDPESYVHRIGRTGRAGKEGTAITFITPSEYKKLMFIQRVAKTEIKKSTVPKVKDIIKAKKRKIYYDLTAILEDEIDEKYSNWAEKLLGDDKPQDIIAALLNYCFSEELNPDAYGEIAEVGRGRSQIDRQGTTRLFVALGKHDKISPKKLVELILKKVPMKPHLLGDIQVMDKFSFIAVPFDKAEQIIASFKEKGRRPLITHVKKKPKNK